MFTLLDAEETRIRSFISKSLSSSRNELEARIFPPIPGQDVSIDYYQFHRVLQRYTFKKELGGFGLPKEYTTQLNVSSDRNPDLRESVKGLNAVKLFWLSNDTSAVQKYDKDSLSRMNKKKKDNVDISNYPVRISLSEEQELDKEEFNLLNNSDFPKYYRLQNRVSVLTKNKLFRIDFTTVKTGVGKTFRHSKTLTAFPSYEIEIEYIGEQTVSKEIIFSELIQNIGTILTVYFDSPILITKSLEQEILDNYRLLIRNNEKFRNSNRIHARESNMSFITANPRTLHRENCRDDPRIPNILRNYGVTYKADGVRMLLYVLPSSDVESSMSGGIFLFNNNFQVLPVGASLKSWENSIVEGEYIRDNHTFYAYDMLYAKGLDIRNKPLESFNESQSSRLQYLTDFVTELSNEEKSPKIKVVAKPHLFGNGEEIFMKARDLWKNREAQPFHVDGLIFTPATDPYPSKPGTWDRLFKWKPPHLNTIDFLIETTKGSNNKDKLFPYIKTLTEEEQLKKTKEAPVLQYKILKLNVSGRTEKYNSRTSKLRTSRGPVLFQEAKVPVNLEGKIMAKDPLSGIVQEIMDNTIVEFSYSGDSDFPWVPIRVRHGKTTQYRKLHNNFGNDERVARDIWRSIQVPLTARMITSGDIPPPTAENESRYTQVANLAQPRLPYQTFHTVYIKQQLLESVALKQGERGAGYLIDFGSSRGGDLKRWQDIGYTQVIGIDLDPDSVEQASLRYERMAGDKDAFDVTFICGDLNKLIFPNYESACPTTETLTDAKDWKELMKLNLPQKFMFDVVSSQFVIHYSFEDELSLRTYFQNVTDNLKIGGFFVGTTFDGQRIYDALKRRSSISGMRGKDKMWEITKLYGTKKFVSGKPNLGMAIDVFVSTIGLPHKEYLVSYPYLANIAKEYGLELQEVTPFSEYWEMGTKSNDRRLATTIRSMSEAEKQFSFFFSSFVFKKVQNAPETTYKKLMKLRKKSKK